MEHFVCATCGVQFAASDEPPAECPVCEDARQWVPEDGQRWTTMDDLASEHRNELRDDEGLTGIGTDPHFAIGQRALIVPSAIGNVLWECVTLLDDAIELWNGETRDVGGLTLLRLGGHFRGGTVLHRPEGSGTLLSGDIVQVIPDRRWVSFMYSYPNLIPLPAETVLRMADLLKPYAFETMQGAWWGTTVRGDAKAIVQRSAERYARALAGDLF